MAGRVVVTPPSTNEAGDFSRVVGYAERAGAEKQPLQDPLPMVWYKTYRKPCKYKHLLRITFVRVEVASHNAAMTVLK